MFAAGSRINRYAFLTGLVLAMGLAYMTCQAEEVERDVIYVPTPEPVVDKMLELVKPQKGEVLYDLGCGDGRIVVTAAKKYGVKAFGYDIDPKRVEEALANVKKAGVEQLVTIEKKDIFTLDLSPASVVTMYLLPTLNVRMIPQLEKLKPGSRVVTHDFDIDGIKPEKTVKLAAIADDHGSKADHSVFLFTIPLKKNP
jgi:precorrin-6B methylase 2